MMAIAHGMALNDLPSLGVPFDKLEILVRATVEGTAAPDQQIQRRLTDSFPKE